MKNREYFRLSSAGTPGYSSNNRVPEYLFTSWVPVYPPRDVRCVSERTASKWDTWRVVRKIVPRGREYAMIGWHPRGYQRKTPITRDYPGCWQKRNTSTAKLLQSPARTLKWVSWSSFCSICCPADVIYGMINCPPRGFRVNSGFPVPEYPVPGTRRPGSHTQRVLSATRNRVLAGQEILASTRVLAKRGALL